MPLRCAGRIWVVVGGLAAAACAHAPSAVTLSPELEAPSFAGCSIDAAPGIERLNCGSMRLEARRGEAARLEDALPEGALRDELDVTAGKSRFRAVRARSASFVTFSRWAPDGALLQCAAPLIAPILDESGLPTPHTAATEQACLGALAVLGARVAPPATGPAPMTTPPVLLPATCFDITESRARCEDVVVAWQRVTSSNDATAALNALYAATLNGAVDAANEGPFACAVRQQHVSCFMLVHSRGGVLYGVLETPGASTFVSCGWAGTPHDVPSACVALIDIVR